MRHTSIVNIVVCLISIQDILTESNIPNTYATASSKCMTQLTTPIAAVSDLFFGPILVSCLVFIHLTSAE